MVVKASTSKAAHATTYRDPWPIEPEPGTWTETPPEPSPQGSVAPCGWLTASVPLDRYHLSQVALECALSSDLNGKTFWIVGLRGDERKTLISVFILA